jgi:hypothetical protein
MDLKPISWRKLHKPHTGNKLHGSLKKVCGDECTQHKKYKLDEYNISVTITVTPKLINFVQLEVFRHIISHQFTNYGNMYTSFMVVVVTAAVALVITVGRHVWHYARSI